MLILRSAKLTLDDAIQHLYHFCATLPAAPYVDRNPIFSIEDQSPGSVPASLSASVSLPNAVDTSIRYARSALFWKTEKLAKRDAAFEAYKTLFHAGLVDDHLLPLGHIDEGVDQALSAVEKRPNLVVTASQINPWASIAQEWHSSEYFQASTIEIFEGGKVCSRMMMLLPRAIPGVAEFQLYWRPNTILKVAIEPNKRSFDPSILASATETTALLMKSVFPGRVDARDDFIALFIPCDIANLRVWVQDVSGAIRVDDVSEEDIDQKMGLIRDLSNNGVPYIFCDVTYAGAEDHPLCDFMDVDEDEIEENRNLPGTFTDHPTNGDESKTMDDNAPLQDQTMTELYLEPPSIGPIPHENFVSNRAIDSKQESETGEGTILLEVMKLPRKIDFLHRADGRVSKAVEESKPRRLSAYHCKMDRLPFRYSQFAMFIPSILHRVQVALVVDHLCEGILSPVKIQDRALVSTAISASSADEDTDYQRLEFFGDSMLKYMTSLSLVAGRLHWHEGILSHQKDHIVANSSLALAALKTGLDQYILSKAFTGRKWRPVYRSELLQQSAKEKREMSTKILADVVEALIGAAYLDGGASKVLVCLKIFLPEISWIAPAKACQILYATYDVEIPSSTYLVQVERLISYQFNSKALLLEALTHGSFRSPRSGSSYQRLEFLGDAILDNIVTRVAFAHEPSILTHRLHLIRTALVNGNYLGFLCLDHSMAQARIDPVTDDLQNTTTAEVTHRFHLWQAMRHASPTVSLAQQECVLRYQTLHTRISSLLAYGGYYPWSVLASLAPPKPMSDMVESLVGAIYVDTQGSLPACETFLQRLGLMSYLHRAMDGRVALLHPKEELGQLANHNRVEYELGKEGEVGHQRLICRVRVGGREIVTVSQGLSVIEVQTRAADEACKVMKKENVASVGLDFESEARVPNLYQIESGQGGEDEERATRDKGNCESDGSMYVTASE